MKELSIKEKAKAYDEAIERANAAYKDEDRHLKAALERIFPELKESEDERIRKLLINLANQTYDGASCFKDFSKEKILAWLQKQGEPTDINPSEFDLRLNKLLKQFETLPKEKLASSLSFYLNVVQNDGTYKDEEKQGEQNPADKLEDEEYNGEDYGIDSLFHAQRILEKTLGKVDGYQTDDGILAHQCAITAVKKLYEHKPAEWSEEDETRLTNIIIMLKEGASRHFIKDDITKAIDWLKSLKPQPKKEWNEEDERTYKSIIYSFVHNYPLTIQQQEFVKSLKPQNNITDEELAQAKKDAYNDALDKIEYHSGKPTFDDGWSAAIDYIQKKSLRPQSQWKPTEEQIRALHDLNLTGNISYAGQGQALIELYEQLKKL